MGVTVVIEKIGMQFARAVEPTDEFNYIPVYLFHSSQPTPCVNCSAVLKQTGVLRGLLPKNRYICLMFVTTSHKTREWDKLATMNRQQ